MATAYAGNGRLLTLTTYSGSNQPLVTQPPDPVIPDTKYSNCEPCNDAFSVSLQIVYASAPTGDTVIQFSFDPTFETYMTLDTIGASSDTMALWETEVVRQGFLRVFNDSNKDINSVTVQKVVASTSGF